MLTGASQQMTRGADVTSYPPASVIAEPSRDGAPAPAAASIARRSAKRVLFLVDSLNIGGTETQTVQAAVRLHSSTHEVTVGCLRAEGPLLDVLRQAGIPVKEFRKETSLLSLAGLCQLLRLAWVLRRERFEVLHAHDLWSSLLGVPAGWLAGTPMVIASRRYLADLEWYTPLRARFIRFVYRLADRVVVNSSAVRDLLIQRDFQSGEKIRVIYNGVDLQEFAAARHEACEVAATASGSAKVVAVVANMYSRVKGHSTLIAAAAEVCREFPRTTFRLIGDGQERHSLEQQVRELGLSDRVEFLGRRSDVACLLAGCDLFVLPSAAEAMPNALLEAMAAGLPVVATRVGGVPEIVEHESSGLLVAPEDPQGMAHAILRLLRNPALAARLACAGQERIRARFSFDRLKAELERLYSPQPLF